MGMTDFYGARDDAESLRTLERGLDMGVNFFDTADMYGPHTNEELLGKFLQGRRRQVVVATKFGIVRDLQNPMKRSICGKPAYVQASCEGSLQRLQTDHIDLYYQHRVDPDTAIEETVGAMAALVQQGKVRFLGLSEVSGETLRRAHRVHPIAAVQSEFSLWSQESAEEILKVCRELGVGFVPYSPLGRGFLTGEIQKFEDFTANDYRRLSPRFQGENFQKNLALVAVIQDLAKARNLTPAQLALAWVINQGEDVVAIPGTKRRKYLEQNVAALDVQLSKNDLEEISKAIPQVSGLRYPESIMHQVNR